MSDLRQSWSASAARRPIVIFGAGSIVSDARLPAYAKGGYDVAGIYNPTAEAVASAHPAPTARRGRPSRPRAPSSTWLRRLPPMPTSCDLCPMARRRWCRSPSARIWRARQPSCGYVARKTC